MSGTQNQRLESHEKQSSATPLTQAAVTPQSAPVLTDPTQTLNASTNITRTKYA